MFLQQRMLHKCNSLKTGIFCAKRAMLICEKHKPILKVIIIQNIPKSLTSQNREPICKFFQLFLWLFSKVGLICSFNQLKLALWRICFKKTYLIFLFIKCCPLLEFFEAFFNMFCSFESNINRIFCSMPLGFNTEAIVWKCSLAMLLV